MKQTRVKALINIGGMPMWMSFDNEEEARKSFPSGIIEIKRLLSE